MLRIGRVEIASPAVQAALSGYSDLPMRLVARAHGAPYCVHEVVIDEQLTVPGRLQRRILDLPAADHPVGGQLMGSVPENFGRAARLLADAGFDVVDINFGCPVPRALGRCRGGYLLGEPATALAIVDAVLDACRGERPVSVKMRRGVDESVESERAFFAILDGIIERGVAAVTVHGRTVRQRYLGQSSWPFLARVKRHVGDACTLLGSGDLFGPHDVVRMLAETKLDGVTIARGCIGNPWIFGQVADLLAGRVPKPPNIGAQRRALEMHRDLAAAHYGNERGLRKFRTHAIKYAAVHPEPTLLRDTWVAVRSFADCEAVFERHYAAVDAERVSAGLTDLALDAQQLRSCAPAGGEL